jgi:hypothetical protein
MLCDVLAGGELVERVGCHLAWRQARTGALSVTHEFAAQGMRFILSPLALWC